MLSIGKVSPGRAGYYEQAVARGRDDYYSGAGEAPGEWIGQAARGLGLAGTVSAEQFEAMIAGRDPAYATSCRVLLSSKRKSRIINGKRHDPVAAYDLTFSSPKSVSVLFATADPAVARELVAAHDQAVRAALRYLEDAAVYTRRGRNGSVIEQGDGLVAAAYRHRMSRSKDPQLHTHVVAANLVRTPSDGQWRTLHAAAVYRHARTAGVLYQSHLRAEISDRLGLRWGPVVKGAAELDGIPTAVLREFSRRRIEIEEAAKQEGAIRIGTKAGAEALALQTRQTKDLAVRTRDWRIGIESRAQEHGWDRAALAQLLESGRSRLEVGRSARPNPATTETGLTSPDDESTSSSQLAADGRHPGDAPDKVPPGHDPAQELAAHLVGPDGLTELQNAFDERDLLSAIAEQHQQGHRVGAVRAEGEHLLRRADVLDVRPVDSAGIPAAHYTTTDLVETERRLVDAATQRAASSTAVASTQAVERALAAADRAPTPAQARAVRAIVRSGNGVDVVEALAGTGKTFTAGLLREVYARDGIDVLGAAPTGRAARELSEVGIPARTLHALMFALERNADLQLPQDSVIVLDEAGMAPTRLTERFFRAAAAAQVKVIAIGDSGQLPSVQAGGWMREVGRQLGAHRLDEALRQRDPEERRMLGLLHDESTGGADYLEWLDRCRRLEIGGDAAALLEQAVTDWSTAAADHGIDQAVLIARDQQTRAVLNNRAREWMLEHGHLGEQSEYGAMTVAVGERLIARRNNRQIDVDNGTRGTVTRLGPDEVELRTDAGATRILPAAYVRDHVEHAYALTGHGMQGATVEWAAVVALPEHLTQGWAYTALSRSRDETHLYIPSIDQRRRDERAELAPHDDEIIPDRQATLARVALRMRVRDDEDLAVSQLLPHQPAAARTPTDSDHRVRQSGQDPQEPVAGRAPPRVPTHGQDDLDELVRLTRHIEELRAQRDPALLRRLTLLDELDGERERIAAQRERAVQRLAELPDPVRRRFRSATDARAGQRAAHRATIAAADAQLRTVGAHLRITATDVQADLSGAHAEHRELEAAIRETDRRRLQIRNQLAERVVAERPSWTIERLGPRPVQPERARTWDNEARVLAARALDWAPGRTLIGRAVDGPRLTDVQRPDGATPSVLDGESARLQEPRGIE